MVAVEDVVRIVGDVLQLGERGTSMDAGTPLLGALPEFDSMAVVSIITAFEDEYGLVVDDDAISAEAFETIGTLHAFLAEQG